MPLPLKNQGKPFFSASDNWIVKWSDLESSGNVKQTPNILNREKVWQCNVPLNY